MSCIPQLLILTMIALHRVDHLNLIEDRIKRMESLLQSSGIVVNPPPNETTSHSLESMEGQQAPIPNDELSNLMISETGAQKFVGMVSYAK